MAVQDEESVEPSREGGSAGIAGLPEPKGRRVTFGKVRRELSEEELSSPGVQKMLLDELDRMNGAEEELKICIGNLHEKSTLLAVSEEKLKTHHAFDVLSSGTIAAGSLIFGAAFSIKDAGNLVIILIILSILLVAIGIVAKVMRA